MFHHPKSFPTGSNEGDEVSETTFFTISNAHYFLGLCGLIKSIRLTGHHNRLVVLDCGLTQSQRDVLNPHCTLFEMPRELASNPMLFKPFPYLLNPTGRIVIIDSDIIVTRSLSDILKLVDTGKICISPDVLEDRWFEEWKQIFELSDGLRHQIYVNSGFIAFSTLYWPDLLKQWWFACEKLLGSKTFQEGEAFSAPTCYGDQDALNAILMSRIPAAAIALLPTTEQVFRQNFSQVEVLDVQKLSCRYRGYATTLLHSTLQPKPWQSAAWRRVRRNHPYITLLRYLLSQEETFIVPQNMRPIWLRSGILGWFAIQGLDIINRILNKLGWN
jgi:hypothetical protein